MVQKKEIRAAVLDFGTTSQKNKERGNLLLDHSIRGSEPDGRMKFVIMAATKAMPPRDASFLFVTDHDRQILRSHAMKTSLASKRREGNGEKRKKAAGLPVRKAKRGKREKVTQPEDDIIAGGRTVRPKVVEQKTVEEDFVASSEVQLDAEGYQNYDSEYRRSGRVRGVESLTPSVGRMDGLHKETENVPGSSTSHNVR